MKTKTYKLSLKDNKKKTVRKNILKKRKSLKRKLINLSKLKKNGSTIFHNFPILILHKNRIKNIFKHPYIPPIFHHFSYTFKIRTQSKPNKKYFTKYFFFLFVYKKNV